MRSPPNPLLLLLLVLLCSSWQRIRFMVCLNHWTCCTNGPPRSVCLLMNLWTGFRAIPPQTDEEDTLYMAAQFI